MQAGAAAQAPGTAGLPGLGKDSASAPSPVLGRGMLLQPALPCAPHSITSDSGEMKAERGFCQRMPPLLPFPWLRAEPPSLLPLCPSSPLLIHI